MLEAGDVIWLLLIALSSWKVVEVIRMPRVPKPVRVSRPCLESVEVDALEVATSHFSSLQWFHTAAGKKLHLRGCQHLKKADEDNGSRRMGH